MFKAFISSNGCGTLVAEYGDFKVDLSDCGLSNSFCYGDVVNLACEPFDYWDLVTLLEEAAQF